MNMLRGKMDLFCEGVPIKDLPKEKLIELVEIQIKLILKQHAMFTELSELIELKYKPKTLIGKLLAKIGIW